MKPKFNRLALELFIAAAQRYGVNLSKFLLDFAAAQRSWRRA